MNEIQIKIQSMRSTFSHSLCYWLSSHTAGFFFPLVQLLLTGVFFTLSLSFIYVGTTNFITNIVNYKTFVQNELIFFVSYDSLVLILLISGQACAKQGETHIGWSGRVISCVRFPLLHCWEPKGLFLYLIKRGWW